MKFQDYPYTRPDIEGVKKTIHTLLEQFRAAQNAEEQIQLLNKINKARTSFETMSEISGVRYTQNVTDELYAAEKKYFDEVTPIYQDLIHSFYKTLLDSPHRTTLQRALGSHLFTLAERTVTSMSSEIIPDLQEENRLTTEYVQLLASAKIQFAGEERNLAGLTPFKESPDRAVRKAANEAHFEFMQANAEKLDDIYDQLVKLRHGMAKKLGYDNFVALAYARLSRSGYDATDIAKFREMVFKYVVPVATRLRHRQAERIGVDKFLYYDESFSYPSGNPTPKGTPTQIVEHARKMYSELSPETDTFFQYMTSNELMDLENRKNKAGGGYCTMISEYGSPFIFSNFNGTSGDVDVLTHEAGHAFQCFESRGFEIPEYHFPTLEACEIHSMSMEFFAWPWMKLFFNGDSDKYKFAHLTASLLFLPYGVAVDEFQHAVYENPDMKPAERNLTWRKIEQKYLPHRDYDGHSYLEAGNFWQRQTHIYRSPFYYIDYVLAQVCAFQFWARSIDDNKNAFSDYLKLCKAGGSKPFLELVQYANLQSPFEEKTLVETMAKVESWLDKIDDKAL